MIVITTPTGRIGATVAESLRAADVPLRLITRDPARLPSALRRHAEIVAGTHSDPAVLDAALAGADALFVVVPPDHRAPDVREHYLGFARPIAEAVRARGVRHLVAVSSLGRGYAGPAGHLAAAWAMDEALETSGVAYRSLQPPFFMENLLHQVGLIRDRGALVLAADPDAPFPMVATDDIAAVATRLLEDLSWEGHEGVPVREPADHTPREIARILSEALGRPVAYQRAALEEYRAQYESTGASRASVDGMVEMAQAQAARVYPPVSADAQGTGFARWCEAVLVPAVLRQAG